MTAAALHRAALLAHDPYDREHVTPFLRNNPQLFAVAQVSAPAPLVRPSLRLTVDTQDDLDRLRELFFRTRSDDPPLAALIAASGLRAPLYTAAPARTLRQEVA
jgi:spore coat polysaccharide biosynthesis protein SpsF (cytidylyltransferase family)